jgi:hypothetical protein
MSDRVYIVATHSLFDNYEMGIIDYGLTQVNSSLDFIACFVKKAT